MIFVWLLLATVLCMVLYRQGGLGKDGAVLLGIPKWMCNTKVRDLGVPLVCMGFMMLVGNFLWWQHLISFCLMFAAMTTYWDKFFGYDHFGFHGMAIGASYLLYLNPAALFARILLLGVLMHFICNVTDNDWVEEFSRGGATALTLFLYIT